MELAMISVKDIVHSRFSAEHSRSYSSETFAELSKSIRMMGIHTPIFVTGKNSGGFHVVIDGDHRLEAAKAAGLEAVPAYIDTTVDPDRPNYEEKILNYISNTQRVNLTVYEAADLFRQLFRDCSFEQIEEAKSRMGLSRNKAELFNKINMLDSKTLDRLEASGIEATHRVIDALLSVRDPEDREDALDRALGNGIRDGFELAEFVESVSSVMNQFSKEIAAHFNGRELPFSKKVAAFLMLFPNERLQLAAVEKLNSIPSKERTAAAAEFNRLLTGTDEDTGRKDSQKACLELRDLVLSPDFPYDRTTVSAVIRFRDVFPDSPEKRTLVIRDLLLRGCLTEDDLLRLTHSMEKYFLSLPEEIQNVFWAGKLPFSDYCFRILDILNRKSYDLPTKLEMIESACAGNPSPEQFENRLAKAIQERDEMIRDVALQTNTDPEMLRNDEDIMRTAGIPEEDIERIRSERTKGSRPENPVKPEYSYEEYLAGSAEPVDEAETDCVPDETYEDCDYLMLADSMARSQETEKHIELELILKGENETIRLSKLYRIADQTCRKCRGERVFKFDTVNYCSGCMLASFIGEIEDSVGED